MLTAFCPPDYRMAVFVLNKLHHYLYAKISVITLHVMLREIRYPDDIWTVRIWTVNTGLGLGLGLGLG